MIAADAFVVLLADYLERHPMLGAAEIAMHLDKSRTWDHATETQVRAWARGENLPGENVRRLVGEFIWDDLAEPEIVEKTIEILDALPDPPKTSGERLARKIWRTFAGELIPIEEMAQRHLLNLPGFIRNQIRAYNFPWLDPTPDKYERFRKYWEGWLAVVEAEIARRAVW